jgi:hypothetical protein
MASKSNVRAGVATLGLALLTLAAGCNALLGNEPWTAGGDAAAAPDTGPSRPFVAIEAGGAAGGGGGVRDSSPGDTSTPSGPADATTAPFDAALPFVESGLPDTSELGLNPLLVVPPPGDECLLSEGDIDCESGETCRIAAVNGGTCDVYDASVMQVDGLCNADSDCGDGMQCYSGECKTLCPLGGGCTGGCECLEVGNETTGICCPGT